MENTTHNSELWTPIENLTYFVSNKGRVVNASNELLQTRINEFGYEILTITIAGKSVNFKVHRLVATGFLPNPENKTQVNHIDCNKLNNCVTNLEWSTAFENMRHAFSNGLCAIGEDRTQAKLTNSDVLGVFTLLAEGLSNEAIATRYAVTRGTIAKIRIRETWAHLETPLTWPLSSEYVRKAKLCASDIPTIRARIAAGEKDHEICKDFGVTYGTINQIRSGKNWKNY